MTTLPIDTLRLQTPGCQQVLHFNNAGAALPPMPVIDAVKQHLDLEASIGGYEAAKRAGELSEKIYSAAAQLIKCDCEEIAFLENATRAWDMAFYSLRLQKGDRILTTNSEYGSNYLAMLHVSHHTGAIIDIIRSDATGQLDIADLQHKIDDKVKLIAITHVPSQGGLVEPAAAVGKIAKQYHIPYMLDATQSAGQIPLDVNTIGCDFLCATGRKYLRGPRGTGFLYVRKATIAACDPPFIDLHSAQWVAPNDYLIHPHAQRFETLEQNIAAKIGLGVAIEYANALGPFAIWDRIQFLASQLRSQLAQIPSLVLHDLGETTCGIVTFSSPLKPAAAIQQQLATMNINVWISLQENARLDLASRQLPALVRASVHYYNTEEEIAIFCKAVTVILT